MGRYSTASIFLWVAVVFGVNGCAPAGEQAMIQQARGSRYSQGYADGCATGRHAAGSTETRMTKDTMQYLKDKKYKEAWHAGYKECKFREERVAKLSNKSINRLRR